MIAASMAPCCRIRRSHRRQQLLFKPILPDHQFVPTRPAMFMRMSAVLHVSPLAAARADHHAAAAHAAEQNPAKEIAAAPRGPVHAPLLVEIRFRPLPP